MVRELDRPADAAALAAFRESHGGDVVTPSDPGYDAARVVWNGIIDRRPALIARCTGAADVINAVRFAREQDLIIAVRAGGHSVGGFSTCDAGIVLDLSPMRGARVDPQARTARVNGGALSGDLDHESQAFGLACPVGYVSHTGVAGLSLGGGMGRLQRKHGLTVDNLISVDMVTAAGQLIHASEEENLELFWGLRGAGANFGVVTSFEFRLHPVGPMVTNGLVAHPIERAHEVVALFRDYSVTAPDEAMVTIGFLLGPGGAGLPDELVGRPIVLIAATHCGSSEAAERDLKPLRGLDPLLDTFTSKNFIALQTANDEEMRWGRRFYMKGAYIDTLSDELVDICMEQIAKSSEGCSIPIWAQGGAVGRVPNDAMAFTGRDAAFWSGTEAYWEDPAFDDAYIGWGRSAMDAIKPLTTAGHYVNDLVESGEDLVRFAYGAEKYERLRALKRTYDPDNVFRMNQNIVP
jgi:FAD/FMN-containing dehydrogenase